MKKNLGIVLVGTLSCLLLFWAVGSLSGRASAQEAGRTKGDLVMMRCNSASPDLAVAAYTGSIGTPSKRGGTCSENLSLLLREGFVLCNTGHYDAENATFVLFTLVR